MEKKTCKQYYARITRRNGKVENGTYRALNFTNSPYFKPGLKGEAMRTTNSYEKAVKYAEWCKEEYAPKNQGKDIYTSCGSIGIVVKGDKASDYDYEVVSYEIKVREVTDWETV